MQQEYAKVWPLAEGLPGYNAEKQPITLNPFQVGWMRLPDALKAQEEDQVQIMVGLRPQDLKQPGHRSLQAEGKGRGKGRGAGTYSRSDMQAKK